MKCVWNRDDDCVKLDRVEHLLRNRERLGDREDIPSRLAAFFHGVGQGGDDGVGVLRERRQMSLRCPPPAPDDPDANLHYGRR